MKCPFLICKLILVLWPAVLWGQVDTLKAQQLLEEAEELTDKALYEEALTNCKAALDIYQKVLPTEHPTLALAYNRIGVALLDNRRLEEAKSYFYQALGINIQVFGKEHAEVAQSYHNLGNYHYDSGQLGEALQEYQNALEIRGQVLPSNHPDLANSLNNIANCYVQLGQLEEAMKRYTQAHSIRLSNKTKAPLDLASSFNNLGNITLYLGNYQQAYVHFQEALNIRKKELPPSHPSIADSYNNLANVYQVLGNLNEAIEALNEASAIYQNLSGELQAIKLAGAASNLGNIYLEKGAYYQALRLHERALSIRSAIQPPDPLSLIESYNNLGNVYQQKGDYGKAILFLRKAESVYPQFELSHNMEYALIYDNLGNCQCQLGDVRAGIQSLNRARKVKELVLGPSNPSLINTLISRGNCYLGNNAKNQRNPSIALANFKEAESIILETYDKTHPYLATIYANIGHSNFELGKLDEALSYFNKTLSATQFFEEEMASQKGQNYLNIGIVYREKGQIETAKHFLNLGLKSLQVKMGQGIKGMEAPLTVIGMLKEVGNLYSLEYKDNQVQMKLDSAIFFYEEAMSLMDSLQFELEEPESKQQLINYNFQVFEGAIKCQYAKWQQYKDPSALEKAFSISERSKAILLLESMRNSQAKSFAKVPMDLLKLEDSLQVEIAYLEKQRFDIQRNPTLNSRQNLIILEGALFDLKQQYQRLIKQIETQFPDFYQLKYDLKGVDLQTVQNQLLEEDQGLIEFFVGEHNLFVWLITQKKRYFVAIPKDFELEQEVSALLDWVQGYLIQSTEKNGLTNEAYLEVAEKLYQQLFGKLPQSELPSRLILIPDDVLGFLPFELLLTQQSTEAPYRFKSHPYLSKKHAISYIYSATLLELLQQQPTKKRKGIVAFAPTFLNNSFNLEELKGNKLEAQFLEANWGATTFVNGEATLDNFLEVATQYNILHLATHGVARGRQGEASYLAFTEIKDSLENEFLYVQDLYSLDIPADMVVLSACETGLGEFKRGEGIVGLARGFFYAGAKSLVPTLWSIDDGSTAELMALFYEKLGEGLPKDIALQQAKIQFIQNKPNDEVHPYFWAAPVVIGNIQSINRERLNWIWIVLGGFLVGGLLWGFMRKKS